MIKKPFVIAHRGACGYLPEHTLEGKAAAFAMGADFVELDAILTRDDRVIVFHDHYLDAMTDVAARFPGRRRGDGRHYAIDFTLEEIKNLSLHERRDLVTGNAKFAGRFPADSALHFVIPTLEEEMDLVRGLNTSMGKNVGIYIEPKGPAYHRKEGKCIEAAVLDVLGRYGYAGREANCYIQSFEPESIRFMRKELTCELPMVQLIGDNSWEETPGVDYIRMVTPEGLDEVKSYAVIIGPWTNHVVADRGPGHGPELTALVGLAHERKLEIHPYTFRADALPSFAKSFDELLEIFISSAGIEGIFTDFPDRAMDYLKRSGRR
jgi:glycerophosphoryl diester phosphodiesterase